MSREVRITFTGEVSSGKSTLLRWVEKALLNESCSVSSNMEEHYLIASLDQPRFKPILKIVPTENITEEN